MSILPDLTFTSPAASGHEVPRSWPRSPFCLTSYPTQTQFRPTSRSTLSFPAASPEQLDIDPFDGFQATRSPKHCLVPTATLLLQRENQKREVPIALRMSTLSPTDSDFSLCSPISLSPKTYGGGHRIPLSPSAKRYMTDKQKQKKVRPDPILIPFLPYSSSARAARSILTARPIISNSNLRHEPDPRRGSVPFPKTPPDSARTAVPPTAQRIGRQSYDLDGPGEGQALISAVSLVTRDVGVPWHRREPSPGWADFAVAGR